MEKGCTCHTLERWPRDVLYTCQLCVETCLADTADVAREKLLQARFLWAWHCKTRMIASSEVLLAARNDSGKGRRKEYVKPTVVRHHGYTYTYATPTPCPLPMG